jgi:hypothetical protein
MTGRYPGTAACSMWGAGNRILTLRSLLLTLSCFFIHQLLHKIVTRILYPTFVVVRWQRIDLQLDSFLIFQSISTYYRVSAYDGLACNVLHFGWCKSDRHSVRAALWILSFDLFPDCRQCSEGLCRPGSGGHSAAAIKRATPSNLQCIVLLSYEVQWARCNKCIFDLAVFSIHLWWAYWNGSPMHSNSGEASVFVELFLCVKHSWQGRKPVLQYRWGESDGGNGAMWFELSSHMVI